MPTWPTVKPVTTTTDADTKSISGARDDINQAITNVNTITDFFNLGTPGASDDDKVLTYDHTTGYIVLETASGGADIGNLTVTGTDPNQTTLTTDATNKDITILTSGTGELLLQSTQKVEANCGFEATGGLHTSNAVRLHSIGTSSTGNLVLSGHTISVDSQGPGGGDQIIINPGTGGTVTIEDELNINNAYTLPSVDGTANYILQTDGSGTVSWVANTGGSGGVITALNNQAENRLVTIGSTTTELDGEANLTFDGSILGLTGTQTITNTTTGDTILATTTEDSSDAAPVFTLKRNSSSPADGDYLGQLKFKGENDADQEVVYAKMTAKISDASSTTEDGLLEFALRKAGANNIGMRLTSTELKLLNGTDLQMTDGNITNDAGSNRGDAFVIGSTNTVETSTSQIVSGIDTELDIYSNSGQRIAGPVKLVKVSDLNTWNDRVHSNCTATKIELTDSFGEGTTGAERGKARIRNGYHDITLNTKGYQFGNFNFERFGDGLSAGVFSAKAFTDVDNGTAHAHTVKAVTLVPQGDGSEATLTGSNKFTINKLIGAEIEPFVDGATDVNTFYGVRVKVIDDGSNQATVDGTITNKYSFYSDNAKYVNYNAGGFTPGAFASTSLPTDLPAGTQIAVSDAASTTNGTYNYQPAYTPDGTNWYYVSDNSSV